MSDLKHPSDVIVEYHANIWQHIATGELHRVVWVSPHEVVSWSATSTWKGKASDFVREFAVSRLAPQPTES